jgi:hypothetical protein
MSAPVTEVVVDDVSTQAAAACSACPHPLDTHDAIDLRFCRATTDKSLTRGCTCAKR